MDIYSPRGTKVRFTGNGGFDSENQRANDILDKGAIYTVDYTDVGGWRTEVYLIEVPGDSFNSVLFESV